MRRRHRRHAGGLPRWFLKPAFSAGLFVASLLVVVLNLLARVAEGDGLNYYLTPSGARFSPIGTLAALGVGATAVAAGVIYRWRYARKR
jgi:hypothetical protein